jgi:dihydroorotate dehydrogenase
MKLMPMFFEVYKKFIFMLPPEKAHEVSLYIAEKIYGSYLKKFLRSKVNSDSENIMGINVANKLGLAAGFDKNGDYINFVTNIGFGFVELGTVTPKPQFGNPKPRIFRVKDDQAIINRLGFNNKGVNYLKNNLLKIDRNLPIGINIGKNSTTKIDKAHEDYEYCMEQIFYLADYITLNISSPNTKNLRNLHSKDSLNIFLKQIKKKHDILTKKYRKHVPLVLKVSPDIQNNDLENFCKIAIDYEIDGIIATNTTIDKSVLNDKSIKIEGGISGKPLFNKSNNFIKAIKAQVDNKIKIIGTGGVTSKQSAIYKLECGADLLQMYTGLVYKGTNLIQEITSNIK